MFNLRKTENGILLKDYYAYLVKNSLIADFFQLIPLVIKSNFNSRYSAGWRKTTLRGIICRSSSEMLISGRAKHRNHKRYKGNLNCLLLIV
jgi:hypothetical protein